MYNWVENSVKREGRKMKSAELNWLNCSGSFLTFPPSLILLSKELTCFGFGLMLLGGIFKGMLRWKKMVRGGAGFWSDAKRKGRNVSGSQYSRLSSGRFRSRSKEVVDRHEVFQKKMRNIGESTTSK